MRTVHQVSEISGISVRALHHYDAIGLLKPTEVTDAGYRLYDDDALRRLQTILMYRELGFALADIKAILDNPRFDANAALAEHIVMLKMQKEHIDSLISAAEQMMKGENADFTAFDRSKMEKYMDEVKAKWGETTAYSESQEKLKGKTDSEKKKLSDGLAEQFAKLGAVRNTPPESPEAQAAVKALQDCITANFYTCTKEILGGLGEMYVADERFKANIDASGGDGTAEFVCQAIRIYCK